MDADKPALPQAAPGVRLDVVEAAATPAKGKPYLQVLFTCANAYLRVFRSADQTQYIARCPKCAKQMRFAVGPGGTDQRTFHVTCK